MVATQIIGRRGKRGGGQYRADQPLSRRAAARDVHGADPHFAAEVLPALHVQRVEQVPLADDIAAWAASLPGTSP